MVRPSTYTKYDDKHWKGLVNNKYNWRLIINRGSNFPNFHPHWRRDHAATTMPISWHWPLTYFLNLHEIVILFLFLLHPDKIQLSFETWFINYSTGFTHDKARASGAWYDFSQQLFWRSMYLENQSTYPPFLTQQQVYRRKFADRGEEIENVYSGLQCQEIDINWWVQSDWSSSASLIQHNTSTYTNCRFFLLFFYPAWQGVWADYALINWKSATKV